MGYSGSHSGVPLTPSRPAPGPATALPVLKHSGRLRRLLQLGYKALHVVKQVVQDVLGDRAEARMRPLSPGTLSSLSKSSSPEFLGYIHPLMPGPVPFSHRRSHPRHLTGRQTKPHSLMEDSHPTAGPAHSLALPLDVWPRLLPRPAPPADWLALGRGGPGPGRPGQRCRGSPPGRASALLLPREWVPPGVVRSPSSVPRC